MKPSPELTIRLREIIGVVAAEAQLSFASLLSADRSQPVADARFLAIHVAMEATSVSIPALGRVFNRDRSSIQYALAEMRSRLSIYPDLRATAGRHVAHFRNMPPLNPTPPPQSHEKTKA